MLPGARKKKSPQEELQGRVGQRIAELRSARGWSQGDLGGEMGRTLRHVAALELGEYNPTLSTLRRVAEALGVDISELFAEPTGVKRAPGRPKRA